jgi:hypothetical protein
VSHLKSCKHYWISYQMCISTIMYHRVFEDLWFKVHRRDSCTLMQTGGLTLLQYHASVLVSLQGVCSEESRNKMDVGNVAFTECVKDIAYALRLFSFGPWCHTCWNEWNNISHMWHCVRPRSQQLLYTRHDDHSCLSGKVALARWLYTYWNKERDVHTNCSHESWFLTCKTNPKKPIFMFSCMEPNSNLPLVGCTTTIYQLLIAYFQALHCNSFVRNI